MHMTEGFINGSNLKHQDISNLENLNKEQNLVLRHGGCLFPTSLVGYGDLQ
jgi:hypothetical protein